MLDSFIFTKTFQNIIRIMTAEIKDKNCHLQITRQKYKKKLIFWHDTQKIKKKIINLQAQNENQLFLNVI